MSQPTPQQATKNKRIIYVATIRFSVVISTTKELKRYLLGHRKLGRNRVSKLKEENVCSDGENYVATGSKSWWA